MRKFFLLIAMMFFLGIFNAHAMYVVDGQILDWGVNLSAAGSDVKGFLNTHLPSGGRDVNYVTEDNADRYNSGFTLVGPGYSTGNTYDAEAMYFDNDDAYAYFAIVSGLSYNERQYPAGDVFLSTAGNPFSNMAYGFAIDVFSGNLYQVGGMEMSSYLEHGESDPWRLTRNADGSVAAENVLLGNVDLVYGALFNTHSVIEARIPLAWIDAQDDIWLHWTMKCGNDYLNLQGNVVVPEPATIVLLGGSLLGLAGLRRRKMQDARLGR